MSSINELFVVLYMMFLFLCVCTAEPLWETTKTKPPKTRYNDKDHRSDPVWKDVGSL